VNRLLALVAACAVVISCGGVDHQKFDRIYKAGKALQTEVGSNSGLPRPQSRDLLKEFDAEIAALSDHTIGKRESEALQAYTDAANAYRYFLRFRVLDLDVDSSQILLKGPNLEVATRYKLPVDSRNGAKWVNRAQAVTILLQAGDQRLSDANRLVKGSAG
jgi:hypothetical protein